MARMHIVRSNNPRRPSLMLHLCSLLSRRLLAPVTRQLMAPLVVPLIALTLCSACSTVYTKDPDPALPSPPATPAPEFYSLVLSPNASSSTEALPANLNASAASKTDQSLSVGSNNLWSIINQGSVFASHAENIRIDKFVAWYQNNPGYFKPIFARAPLYLGHITGQLQQHQMPLELALLPFVESAYNPFAYSRSNAAGLWQFIPPTGDHMGLARNWWYDGRRDVEQSTEAAIEYLSYLNRRFKGDWLLTLAAYNGGEGTVSRAMERNARAGKATDFWSLDLSRETRAYVPRLLALARICANPENYGLSFPVIADTQRFTGVDLSGRIHLNKVAELAGIDHELARKLNPGLRQGVTPPAGPHRIIVPLEKAAAFEARIAATPKHLWQPARQYTVKSGDTLGAIALKNGVPLAAMKAENNLLSNRIKMGKVLNIPGTGVSTVAPLDREANPPVYYRIKQGDSLWAIARRFDVSSRALSRWNNLAPGSILQPGQRLRVYPSARSQLTASSQLSSHAKAEVHYRVKRGDSLYTIARRHRISIADILLWNKIKSSDLLQPGQRLRLLVRS